MKSVRRILGSRLRAHEMQAGHGAVRGKQKDELFSLAMEKQVQSAILALIHAFYPSVREKSRKFFHYQ